MLGSGKRLRQSVPAHSESGNFRTWTDSGVGARGSTPCRSSVHDDAEKCRSPERPTLDGKRLTGASEPSFPLRAC
jgi:hypothetical protein